MSASKQFPSKRGSFFSIKAPSDKLEETSGTERFQERLQEITEGGLEGPGRINRLLQLGAEWLGVEGGYLSEIDPAEGTYEIVATGGPNPPVSAGEAIDLSSTYCRKVIAEGEAFAIENAPKQGWRRDAAYETFGLSTYLGAKVVVEGELHGTICFAGEKPREEPFNESDAAALVLIAWAIEEELEKRLHANLSRQGEISQPGGLSGPGCPPYKALFEQAPDMAALFDLGGSFVATNRQFREQTGYDAGDLTTMKASDLFASTDPDTIPWEGIEPGERRRVETQYQRTDGATFPVEVTLQRLDLDGPGRVVGAARDISHRKRRERQLDAIVSNTSNPIYIKDQDGRYQFVNEAAAALFDTAPPEVLGKTDEDLFDPESAADIRAEDERVMETGRTLKQERVRLIDGTEHVYLDNKYPYHDEEGEVVGVVGISHDITSQKEQHRKLRDAKDLLETTFESLEEAVVVVDGSNRKIILCNGATEEILGYEAEDFRGRHFETLTYKEDVGKAQAEFEALVAGERPRYTIEKRYRRGDGEVFWARLTASLFQHEGETQVIGMVEDIDDRKRYEEGLRKAKDAAEEANRMKSALLANMSHEIRTPLTSIIGFAEAIGDEIGEQEGPAGRFARLIESSGHRLMETLDGVLTLSKLEAAEMNLSLGPVDATREAEAMAEEFGQQAEKAGVDLRIEAPGRPVWAQADEQALQIALRNLVSNAIKYAGKEGTVTVRTYQEEEAVALEVTDNGIGMAPEKVERLFEPFRQESEGWARTYEGTGLGLTVTKKAVGQMGGSIEVETEKGEGSRFTVLLPRAEEKDGG